ncbi:unnamed protein product [Penicillium salamii]|uniref:FCP1 homology domain-containing protein n=1 Tax=Penicillium salamii TaxID=1612424 RepID=A0A9W4NHZ5_9EURO|nr:unnamed protein product [Penicillium salamii]CAG8245473.1 unnamed protein product [Penicillium salamii]CAG8267375.1 unnamed protein product [Penicillium salamii]CAG8267498.1 unnamed protein product [Penicillium salamii]CAG8281242.1 unnamed protein product [Penicillium salamii]
MSVTNVPPSIDESSERDQGTDATEIQDASAVAPSDPVSLSADPTASTSAAEEPTSKKRHLLIPIPSRRSSKTNKQSGEKTEDAQEEPRRGSKVSILRGKRDHSRASSKRSRRTQDGANVEENKETATAPETSSSKPPKKGPNKLLAFLGCCSSSDVDGDDAALPAKKTTMRPATSNRLPTPDKAEAHTGDSSTAESREPYLDEKANSTVSADQPGDEERNLQAVAGGAQAEGPSTSVVQPEISGQKDQREEISVPAETDAGSNPVADLKTHETSPDLDGQTSATTEDLPPAPTSTVPTSNMSDKSIDAENNDDTVNHQEETPQSAMVLPPPPPAPAPPARGYPENVPRPLLPAPLPHLSGRKCLVLDLDETLVHSSFKVLERADFTIPVEIEGQYHNIYVIKRPGVDAFMKRVGELYEVVVFTASVSKYGDPLLDQLDIHNVVHHRLFRESCYNHQGNYVKDLSQVGRDLKETIIIDNSPTSYIFHPEHAIPISSWFSDAHDNELLDLIPVLEDLAGPQVQDVSMVLDVSL